MANLTDWILESDQYEFYRSYGIQHVPTMEFVERQEDFYITLLCELHELLEKYYETNDHEEIAKLKKALFNCATGLLVYSQKETQEAFHGVLQLKNQLYVASLYYLSDFPAIAAWVMGDIQLDAYEDVSGQLLAYIITGGRAIEDWRVKEKYREVYGEFEQFLLSGEDGILSHVVDVYNEKYIERNFESPTDFYITSVLRCVLKKFRESNIWHSLRIVDPDFNWNPYAAHSYGQHILSFLPSQQDALDKGLIGFDGSFSLKMPTSAGKSYITELLIYHELTRNPKARVLYLAPLRALSRELRDRFRKIHKTLGFTYATKYGGSAASVAEDTISEAQLLIATPESFMSIESADQESLDNFTLVICDEGQLLDDFSRGINYEMLLSRLRKHEHVRFLFISAIIPNIEVVNRWLKGSDDHIGDSRYRPSRLILSLAIVKESDVELQVFGRNNRDVKFSVPSFITKGDAQIDRLLKYDGKAGVWKIDNLPVDCTLAIKSLKAGSVFLFATSKSVGVSCVGLTKHLINLLEKGSFDSPLNYVKDQSRLDAIVEYISYQLGEEHLLCKSLTHGFAFHHGDVPQDIREQIERAYDKGIIRLIIGNTTLAEGVNLPIKTIILANAQDYGNNGYYLPNTRLKNIIGRVGRAGRERYGTIIVPTQDQNSLLIRFLKEAMNPDDSALVKMHGTLYSLVDFLVRKGIVKKDDVNELLSETAFSDAIDEMIIRSSDGNISELDPDQLITDSLAYSLSDDSKQEALRKVFKVRHDVLKQSIDDHVFGLLRNTGLNLRELAYVRENLSSDQMKIVCSVSYVGQEDFVSMMLKIILDLPTIHDYMKVNLTSKKKQCMFGDVEQLTRISTMWMEGKQYKEIAAVVELAVDDVILLVMFLQGIIHDKAMAILLYMKEVEKLDNSVALYWPEYLRLGINLPFMYNLHKLRIPERIQLHALTHFFVDSWYSMSELDVSESLLMSKQGDIENYMIDNGYPRLSIANLMYVIESMKKK
jgi:replicative superfamily II helicase